MVKIVFRWGFLLIFFLFLDFDIKVFCEPFQNKEKVDSEITINCEIELTTEFEVIRTVRKKIRVLNQEGLSHATIRIYHDELTSIEDFKGEITDANTGKRIDKVKEKDLRDVSRISNMSVYEDSRLSYYELKVGKFPVDFVVEYITKTEGNFGFSDWNPVPITNQRVHSSSLKITYPDPLGLRYKQKNIEETPKIFHIEGKTQLSWEVENALLQEEPDEEDEAVIKIAPKNFSMEGYASNMETWNGLGQWINKINAGKSTLPDPAKAKVAELVQGKENPMEKIKSLYQYVQENYRYVSIQLGIGGLMPMSSEEVFKKKYGDCKALSMFMKALLEEAGITANYTLVKAGSNAEEVEADFPSSQFNHVILQVPLEKDTVWLECTSKTLPAGFLGSFTMDRNVLVMDQEGGSLQRTPRYNSSDFNQISIHSQFSLLENGKAKVKQTKNMKGLAAEPYIDRFFWQDRKDFERFIYNDLGFSGAHIEDYDLRIDKKESLPKAEFEHETFLEQFYQSTQKRVIISPKYQEIHSWDIKNNHLHWEEQMDINNLDGMEIESAFPNLDLSEEHFHYKRELLFEDASLKVARTVDFHFPEDVEEDVIEQALKEIEKLDSQPIFLKK